MKIASVLLLSLAASTYAAAQSAPQIKPPAPAVGRSQPVAKGASPEVVKKMGSVTWDTDTHKLGWVVQTGSIVNGAFVPASEERYEISPDEATMGKAEEQRGLDGDEAADLHELLDILSLYCAKSVVWWDHGAGVPVQSKPDGPDSPSPQKPVKINYQQANPGAPRVLNAPAMIRQP